MRTQTHLLFQQGHTKLGRQPRSIQSRLAQSIKSNSLLNVWRSTTRARFDRWWLSCLHWTLQSKDSGWSTRYSEIAVQLFWVLSQVERYWQLCHLKELSHPKWGFISQPWLQRCSFQSACVQPQPYRNFFLQNKCFAGTNLASWLLGSLPSQLLYVTLTQLLFQFL